MAQTVAEIKKEMTDAYIANAAVRQVYGLESGKTFEDEFSTVSVESIVFYVVAYCLWTLQKVTDTREAAVRELLAKEKAHTTRWYAEMLKRYQHGRQLAPDTDRYDNTGVSDADVAAQQVVKNASVSESVTGRLLMKVRGTDGPLTDVEVGGLEAYVNEVKDAGVKYDLVSTVADDLYLSLLVFYDAKIMDASGKRIDGTGDRTVQAAIDAYVTGLSFDDWFTTRGLENAVAAVDGVVSVELREAYTRYSTYDFKQIVGRVRPYSGWMKMTNSSPYITWNKWQ